MMILVSSTWFDDQFCVSSEISSLHQEPQSLPVHTSEHAATLDNIFHTTHLHTPLILSVASPQISKEVPRENIDCSGGQLGEGQFGEVFKGRYTRPDGKVVDAAIKMCKPNAGNKELVEFLREAAIMGQFDHPHIIAIFG